MLGQEELRECEAGLACGHEQLQRVESADAAQRWGAGNQERSVRQVDWRVLGAHRWVRQRASHNRRTPQVTDHGLLSEHQ